MVDESQSYASFLLRLWEAEQDGKPIWHVSLESVQTGERQMFTDLAALYAFLTSHCANKAGGEPTDAKVALA